jgi:hypothetical protein
MESKFKIYIFYTQNIKHLVDMLIESGSEIENTEFIPVLHEVIYENCKMGDIGGEGYLEMCLYNHLTKLKIMKENLGSNIMLVDADIVFNKKLNFIGVINNLLLSNDFLFQYDPYISLMTSSINLGIIAVKCSERSINLWETHCNIISNIPKNERKAGFPQTEFNHLVSTEEWKSKISYQILPETFGFAHQDSYCYHAIGISGIEDKIKSLQSALEMWNK